MKRRATLLSSAMVGAIAAAPVQTPGPIPIRIEIADDSTCRVTVGGRTFVLPDQREAFVAALRSMPDKTQPVVLSAPEPAAAPARYIGGVLYLVQSAGFEKITVVNEPPAD